MTSSPFRAPAAQPPAPAPPSAPAAEAEAARLADRIDAANRAVEEATRRADARAASADMGVVKGADGVIVVTTREGKTIRIDPQVVTDRDDVRHLIQTALAPPPRGDDWDKGPPQAVAIVTIVFFFVTLLVMSALIYRSWARRHTPAAPSAVPPDLTGRLARIEQAIEAVAIEVERISESERYSARLLTERLPAAVPAPPNGQAPAAPAATPTIDATR